MSAGNALLLILGIPFALGLFGAGFSNVHSKIRYT